MPDPSERPAEPPIRTSIRGARVVVLDAQERAALAVVRSLVRAGCEVYAVSHQAWSLGGSSRGARAVQVAIDPLATPREYAAEIAALIERVGADVVLPVSDASVESLLEYRALLPPSCALPFASVETYRKASDKLLVHRLALTSGLGILETAVVQQRGDPVPTDASLYPGVVKPHRSVVGGSAKRIKLSVRQVANSEACAQVLRELPPAAFPVLVQRRVIGPGEGYFAARWRGHTLARFAHRRLREKPPSGGVSVFRESMAVEPELQVACDKLLDQLGWEGVAMVECKRDIERGGWRLIEINGRFWGSLELAVLSGADFPALLVAAALALPIAPPPKFHVKVRLRWEWGDIDHSLIRLLRSDSRLNLPVDAPSRLRAVLGFFAMQPGRDHLEVLRLSDPLPFVVETLARIGIHR